jgi:hypothetical protein
MPCESIDFLSLLLCVLTLVGPHHVLHLRRIILLSPNNLGIAL